MVTTRNFIIVVTFLLCATAAKAQWLTKADECLSSRVARIHPQQHEADEPNGHHDAGIDGALKWYWGQRRYGLGYIPKDALHKAYAQTNALRANGKGASAQAAAPKWTLDGPSDAGGRIESLAIDPTDPNIVYAGAANGGVWKTTDGIHWLPMTDNQESISMGSLAIDPENHNVVFAGTGEFPSALDAYSGYGLLRSSDGGQTWLNVGPTNVASYSKVIVNPRHSNLVYAAAGRSGGGVLRSKDGGLTWSWLADSLPPNASVSDMALSMNGDVAVLYAAIPGRGVYRSTDGGDTWRLLENLPFNQTVPVQMVRLSVDVDPTTWQNVVVLSVGSAGAGAGQDDLEGIYSSNDGGETWNEADYDLKSSYSNGPFYEGPGTPPQGWYDVYIRVDPSDFGHWLVGGVRFCTTHDGGQTWDWDNSFHVDQHDAQFYPANPKIVYIGSDGGVFSSTQGADRGTVNSAPMEIPNSEFYTIAIDQSQTNMTYGGLQDNGVTAGSTISNWNSFAQAGDGAYTVADPNHPLVYFINECNTTQLKAYNTGTKQVSGMNFNPHTGDFVNWLNPLCLDSKNEILYLGLDHLYYCLNPTAATPSWTRCLTKLAESGDTQTSVQAIDVFGDKLSVVCGTSGGRVFVTGDNGKTFKDVSRGLPGRSITCVKFNTTTKTTFYATCSGFGAGHVFKTTDNGATWTNISSTLPDISVNSIKMDPTNPTVLYVGTDVGVFFSPNDGGVWMPYGTGLPNTAIDFMDIQVANRILRVGTHGRSVWEVPLSDDQTGIILPAQRTVWTYGDSASIQWHGFGESVTIDLSLDAGASWQNIVTNVGGSYYKIDTVKYSLSENALIRVSDGNNILISPLFIITQQKAGNELVTVGELPFYIYDIAYDKDDNVLWGTNFNATDTHIYKLDPDKGNVLDSVKISPIQQASTRSGFTGIKYDPVTKHLFIQQVNTLSATSWESYIYEVTTKGSVVKSQLSPADYGTGIYVKKDTLLIVDRMGPGDGVTATDQDLISGALTTDWNFSDLSAIPISEGARNAIYGPRSLTFDSKLNQFLLAYTDFQGSLTSSVLNGSYILFLDPVTGDEKNALSILEGGSGATNIRGMEYDPRGAGNSAWVTILSSGNSAKLVKIALTDGPSPASTSIASFSLTSGTINFGNVDTGITKTMHATIQNTGTVTGSIQSLSIQPSSSEFSLGTVSLPATLKAGDTLGVDVTFSSHLQGALTADLVVSPPSGEGQPTKFGLTGFGTVNGEGVSMNGESYGWSLELSPNPAHDFVEVDLGVERTTAAEIRIFDATGREVKDQSLGTLAAGDHSTEISTNDLASGIYFVRVTGSNGEVAAARLLIEK